MANSLLDLPNELLLQVALHLSFSDLWYFRTCSKSTRRLGQELILSKYGIDLLDPQLHPFAYLVYSATAFLERNSQDPSTCQWIANHLAIAIHDRLPKVFGIPSTLDYFMDVYIGIFMDSLFLDLPYCSPCQLREWNQLQPYTPQASLSSAPPHDTPEPTDPLSSLATPSSAFPSPPSPSSSSSSSNLALFTISTVSDTSASLYTATIHVADLLSTLDNVLSILFSSNRQKSFIVAHLHRMVLQLTHQYRRIDEHDRACCGLRICVLLVCRLVDQGLLSIAEVNSFAGLLPGFFITAPSDVHMSWNATPRPSPPPSRSPSLGTLLSQRLRQQQRLTYPPTQPDLTSSDDRLSRDPLSLYINHPHWPLWLQETKLRMMIVLDLARGLIAQYHARKIARLDIQYLTNMLQETVSAFNVFK